MSLERDPMEHNEADLADVSDGNQVIDGVAPPSKLELSLARDATPDEIQAVIDAHVEEVNIHDGRDR